MRKMVYSQYTHFNDFSLIIAKSFIEEGRCYIQILNRSSIKIKKTNEEKQKNPERKEIVQRIDCNSTENPSNIH